MTVPSQTPVSTHVGNGITTSFAYGFKLLDDDDLTVSVDGVAKTLGVDYTVTGVGVDAGGNVVFGAAPANLASIALVREVTIERLTDYQYSGDFQSPTVNRDFDRVIMMLQDSGVSVANALRYPPGDPASGLLPDAAGRALKGLAFDADGDLALTAASGNADVLAAALLSTTVSTGGALVGFDPANAYAPNTVGDGIKDAIADAAAATANVNTFKTNLALQTAAGGTGATLVGYKLNTPNTVGRSLQDRLESYMDASDFGLSPLNTGAQNVAAWAVMKGVLAALGGGRVHFRRGTYDFNTTIDLSVSNVCISGEGIDATILRTTHASADFIQINLESVYQEFRDLTLSSSVTRTGGSMFHAVAFWRRGLMHRVKVMNHFHGIDLSAFEVCTLSEVVIATPSGAGISLICGAPSVPQTGANLTLLNCFLRGHDDLNGAAAPVSAVGIVINDCQAVFGINCDIGGYRDQCMVVQPTTAAYNHHFVQCYFDGTKLSDNVLLTGAGTKDRFQFTGCWFNGAGQLTGGSADCFGVNFTNNGTYSDFNFSGCRFVSQKASAISVGTPYGDINLNGCVFNNVADTSATYRYSIYVAPASAQVRPMNITGCKFRSSGNALSDLHFATNARGNAMTGNMIEKGVTYASGATWAKCSGNADASSDTIASADPFFVSPTKDYYNVTGSVTIGTMPQTYPGHLITLVAINGLTWNDSAGIKLAGNYVAPAQGTLHLRCEGTGGGWREVSRVNA